MMILITDGIISRKDPFGFIVFSNTLTLKCCSSLVQLMVLWLHLDLVDGLKS